MLMEATVLAQNKHEVHEVIRQPTLTFFHYAGTLSSRFGSALFHRVDRCPPRMHLRSWAVERHDVVVRIGEVVPSTVRILVLRAVALAAGVPDRVHILNAGGRRDGNLVILADVNRA